MWSLLDKSWFDLSLIIIYPLHIFLLLCVQTCLKGQPLHIEKGRRVLLYLVVLVPLPTCKY